MTPADLGIAAAILNAKAYEAGLPASQADAAARAKPRRMWLVTKPGPQSELADVLWECDWIDLGHAFKGGLEGEEVVGLYTDENDARKVAITLMARRDAGL